VKISLTKEEREGIEEEIWGLMGTHAAENFSSKEEFHKAMKTCDVISIQLLQTVWKAKRALEPDVRH
jgi:hypothetical protein